VPAGSGWQAGRNLATRSDLFSRNVNIDSVATIVDPRGLVMTRNPTPKGRSKTGEQGYALLTVLIAVALVSVLLGVMESGAREEAKIAMGLRDQAQAQATADGAVWQAAWQALPGHEKILKAGNRNQEIVVGTAQVFITAENLADRVDLNRDPAEAIAAALRSLHLGGEATLALAERLVDWRSQNVIKEPMGAKLAEYRAASLPYGPPNANYENLAEISLIPGMTPQITKFVANLVTIYSFGPPRPYEARNTDERAGLKIGQIDEPYPPSDPPSVYFYSFTARSRRGNATAFRSAVFRLDMNANNQGNFWRLLSWDYR